MASIARQETRCGRCGVTILRGQAIDFDQKSGRWVPRHADQCPSVPSARAAAAEAGFVAVASESSSDWSVSVEEHETQDPEVPKVTIFKVSRIRMKPEEVEQTIVRAWSMIQRRTKP